MKYMARARAAEFLTQEAGIEITVQNLADRACKGAGPRYAKINGRVVYTEADLIAWIEEQASRPVVRRSQRRSKPATEGV